MKKKKAVPMGKMIEKVAKRLQLLVRLKASNELGYCACVTCPAVYHYKEMQGGHFIPRGCSETKLMEDARVQNVGAFENGTFQIEIR